MIKKIIKINALKKSFSLVKKMVANELVCKFLKQLLNCSKQNSWVASCVSDFKKSPIFSIKNFKTSLLLKQKLNEQFPKAVRTENFWLEVDNFPWLPFNTSNRFFRISWIDSLLVHCFERNLTTKADSFWIFSSLAINWLLSDASISLAKSLNSIFISSKINFVT